MRDYLPFLFSFFFLDFFVYIFLSKDCMHCNVCASDGEWANVVEYIGPIIRTPTQYWRNVHKSFLI
jgi:hypothetical protein